MEKTIGFTAAYALPLGLMVIALIILICGQRHFAEIAHENTLPQATKIIACAIKHGFKMKCAKPDYQSQRRHRTVPWSGANVDELTRGLHCCRVLLSFIVFYVCFDQMQNNLISQASQMYTRGTPNDILPAFNQVGCIVMMPLIQYGLYPILHRRRIYLGPIMRITIGFVFVALSMIYAAFVQHAIYKSTPCGDHPHACSAQIYSDGRRSVWLQVPIYILISTGEVFCLTTGMEYAYDHSPQGMKVLVQAIGLLMAAFGSTIALALTTVAYDPNLVIFYASLAGAMTLTTVVAWLLFRKHDKIERLAETPEPPTQNATDVEKGSEHTSPTTPSASSTTLATQCSDVGVDISRLSSTSIATSDPTTSNGSSTDTLVSHPQKQPCHAI
jgi:POT family proton-dependent oligopeptide transporter